MAGCDFCSRFDFSTAKIEIDKYGARIALAMCNTVFDENEQFNYCPKCGKKLKSAETADKVFKNATYKAMSMIYEALLDTNKVFTSKEAEDAVGDALYDMKCAVEEDN